MIAYSFKVRCTRTGFLRDFIVTASSETVARSITQAMILADERIENDNG